MKRSWHLWAFIGGLAVILAILGVHQYLWLVRISATDAEKERARVGEQAERFAADFNREVQSAYLNFQTVKPGASGDAGENDVAARYDLWRANAGYPDLVAGVYFYTPGAAVNLQKYDPASRSVVAATGDETIQYLAAGDKVPSVDAEHLLLYIPVFSEPKASKGFVIRHAEFLHDDTVPPRPSSYIVLRLDPATIKERIIPELSAKYFGDGRYRIGVIDRANRVVTGTLSGGAQDASAHLFDLSPDNVLFFARKETMPKMAGGDQTVILRSRVADQTITRTMTHTADNVSGTVKIEVKGDLTDAPPSAKQTVSPAAGPWTLGVQNVAGSIEAAADKELTRSLMAAFGLLLLVAAAVGAIIFSTVRMRRFAQRQVDFVSSVSHEFRTPLAVIYSAGENLADGVTRSDGQIAEYGSMIKAEGRKLSSMVEQILDFAGANKGKRRFFFSPTNVSDVVSDALDGCRSMMTDQEIALEKDVPADLPLCVADRTALAQALQNLIANAVKYSPASKWVRISAVNGGGSIKLTVEDKGIGIAAKDLKHIFQPFYRSQDVVDAQIHGSGLGLSLVKQVMDAHKGRVHSESELGKGSRFTLELRCAE